MSDARRDPEGDASEQEIRESLSGIPCLRALNAGGIDALAGLVRRARYPRGALVARQGDAQGALHQIVSGRVRLYRVAPDGREQNLWVRGTGECFCLSPLDPGLASPFNVECTADTELLVLDPRACRDVLGDGSAFDTGVVRCLGERLGDLAQLAERLTGSSVPQRLAGTLLELADRKAEEDTPDVLEPITHEELAASVGTAREVVSRTLKRFADSGWIRVARRRVELLDRDALAREAGGSSQGSG